MATITILEIWGKAKLLYKHMTLSVDERIILKSDFRFAGQIKAAGSVMDTIAEYFERDGIKQLINQSSYAKESCGKVQSRIYRLFNKSIICESERI